MHILVTSSRMPFAVDEIRKLGEGGHEVTAADTFRAAPGSHSRGAARHVEVPAPTQETEAFVSAVADTITEQGIEWVLPMFEEVFYLAFHRDRLEGLGAKLFFPPFETLATVHDKATFTDLCKRLDLPVAETITTTSVEEFKEAIDRFPKWFARGSYGRGGLNVLTNAGPLAGEGSVDDIEPTPEDPWLVQQYLEGEDFCSWSVVHDGRVALHSTYKHALEIDNRGGIVFESVTPPETLEAASRIAAELNWDGQISFDYLRAEDGQYYMVECNPRPTSGCTIATSEEFNTALFDPAGDQTVVVPAGRKRSIKEAVVRDMMQHLHHFKKDLAAAKDAPDVYGTLHDPLPLLYTVLSLQHVHDYRKTMGIDHRSRLDLTAAQFYDIEWDGSPIG